MAQETFLTARQTNGLGHVGAHASSIGAGSAGEDPVKQSSSTREDSNVNSTEEEKAEEPVEPSLLTVPATTIISRIVHVVAERYKVRMACVALEAPDGIYIKAAQGFNQGVVAKPSILQHKVKRALPIIIQDASASTRFSADAVVHGDPPIRFVAEAPFMVSSSDWIGALCIADQDPRNLSLNDTGMLVEAAGDITQIYQQYLLHGESDFWTIEIDAAGESASLDELFSAPAMKEPHMRDALAPLATLRDKWCAREVDDIDYMT